MRAYVSMCFGDPWEGPVPVEQVVAAVVASAPVSADELLDLCRGHIASFKKPKRIAFVDALPKNAYGKIVRREVRASLTAA